jgi:hypothetical protein
MSDKNCIECAKKTEDDYYCFHGICERFGLSPVASFDDPKASYSFDSFEIYKRDSDGALFYATDSGCSCPTPFKASRFGTIDALGRITPNSWGQFKIDLENYAKHTSDDVDSYDSYRYIEASKVSETLDIVRGLLYAKEAA